LETFQVEYETVNVLEDDAIREGVKAFSQWPTIPQLYINGEFIGGSDIMMEMYESGELKKMMEQVKKD
jgi:monothiol glutaredoxin